MDTKLTWWMQYIFADYETREEAILPLLQLLHPVNPKNKWATLFNPPLSNEIWRG